MTDRIENFALATPEGELVDLRDRLARTRWPHPLGDEGGWAAGTDPAYMRGLVDHWLNSYDWRAQERAINALPHFRTAIDGVPVHFIHVKGKGPNPMALILNHGWPWTFWDMRKIIAPLADPAAHGGDPSDAFDVVVPSLPGFAFSSPLEKPGMFFTPTADLWVKLMDRLGYPRFATQGGDIGAAVSTMLGHRHPDRVIGVHLHLLLALGAAQPRPEDFATPEEAAWGARTAAFLAQGSGYMQIQRTRPMTLSFAMHDSPVGQAAWLIEKRHAWSDCGGDVESVFDKDDLITTAMLYWLTGTFYSATRHYYDARPDHILAGFRNQSLPVVPVPTAALQFKHDVMLQPRAWAERYYDLRSWRVEERGGHFAPVERPDLLVADIRRFFSTLRP